jgi:5-(carboxyamino)imidazole ribonucleotide mutase
VSAEQNVSPVAIIMGSDSDLPVMKEAGNALDELGVAYSLDVMSAHRTPEQAREFAQTAADRGVKVIIAGAGGAAHLPGVIAAYTSLPVIGVPITTPALNGLDSLLSIVQMPAGVPVATVAIGGARNAGILAAEMLALYDGDLRARLAQQKLRMAQAVVEKAQALRERAEAESSPSSEDDR